MIFSFWYLEVTLEWCFCPCICNFSYAVLFLHETPYFHQRAFQQQPRVQTLDMKPGHLCITLQFFRSCSLVQVCDSVSLTLKMEAVLSTERPKKTQLHYAAPKTTRWLSLLQDTLFPGQFNNAVHGVTLLLFVSLVT